jgi:ketosteroid isomerase-like protein
MRYSVSMSEENVEVVRGANEAWLRGDLPAALELVAETIVTTQPPTQADARTYVGHDGLRQAMADWGGQWDDWQVELLRVFDAHPHVVAVLHQRGRGKISGVEVATELGCVYTVEGGKIVRWQMFFSEREALEAVGLSEHSI